MKNTILFISHEASRTGAPILLLNILKWLRQHTNVSFRILLKQGGPLAIDFQQIAPTDLLSRTRLSQDYFADIGLIYSNTCVNGMMLKALPLRGVPIITHFHELDYVIDGFGTQNIAAVKEQTTHYIACAEAVAAGMRLRQGIPGDKISVAYGAIPVAAVLKHAAQAHNGRRDFQIASDEFLVLGCGTAEGRKGADLFLQLAGALQRQGASPRKLSFRWIGTVPADDRAKLLQSDIRMLGLAGCVKFLGLQENPYLLLSACDLFCLPSREDPFPLVMLEAGALKKPTVCFAGSGGAEEYCRQGGGVAVPYLDVEAMSQQCLELIKNDTLRSQIGESASRLVQEKYDINVLAPRILEIIQPWIKAADGPAVQILEGGPRVQSGARPSASQPGETKKSSETALSPDEPASPSRIESATTNSPVAPAVAEGEEDHLFWRNDESLRSLENRLMEHPRTLALVSFDVFDTLVSRLCAEPTDLFVEVGRRLAARGLLRQPLSPLAFKDIRVAAEGRARRLSHSQGRSLEITLADIYTCLGPVVTEAQAAMEVELEVECAMSYLNPGVASLVRWIRSLGYKTAIVSDTYFTVEQLRRLLSGNGLDACLFDAIYASSESGCSKGDGGLYKKLFAWFDIHPNELLHIGDNLHTDIRMATEMGVEAVHYYRTNAYHEQIFFSERNLRGKPVAYTNSSGASLNSMRVMAARRAESIDDAYRDGAFVYGPVLARFADWCVERFSSAGVTTVLALMREGEILGELVRRAARFAGRDLKVVLCYASRMATAYPAMEEVTVENLDALGIPPGVTLKAILDILGIAEEVAASVPQEQLFGTFDSPQAVHGVNQFLSSSPSIKALIESRRGEQHRLAFEYLTSLVGKETTIGILDLGWSGTMQKNISRILRRGGRQVHTVGCYLAATPRAAAMFLDGDEAHGYLELAHVPILAEVAEVAVTACIGSTNGYARAADGQVLPVLAPYPVSATEVKLKGRIRDGIDAFQELWLSYRRRKAKGINPAILGEIDSQSAAILLRLVDFPTKPEADRLGVIHHDENFFGYSRQLCDWRAQDSLDQHGAFMLFGKATCFWPQGVVARHSPRSVLALDRGWRHAPALGRLGVQRSYGGQVSSVTEEELAMLLELLRGWNPQKVIYGASSLSEVRAISGILVESATHPNAVTPLSATPHPSGPRLIVVGPVNPDLAQMENTDGVVCVAGDPARLETLRKVRALLGSCRRGVLVLTDSLPVPAIQGMLNYLAPHLWPEGIITTNHGRFDTATLENEQPLTQVLGTWQRERGADLGYQFSSQPQLCGQANYNWTTLSRSSCTRVEDRMGQDYWALTLPSLSEDLPAQRVLIKS